MGLVVKGGWKLNSQQRGRPLPPPAPITLIRGGEDALVLRATTQIRTAVQSVAPDVEIVEFSAQTYEKGELATHASGSLFSDERLLIISDLDKMSDDFATDFENYVKNPAQSVWVIAQHRGGNKGARIIRALKAGKFPEISAAPVKGNEQKAELVADEVRSVGGSITRQAAADLVAALGGELGELLASARQLVADCGGDITPDAVRIFHQGRVETRPFEVAQALAEHDSTRALLLLRQALGTKVPLVVIVAALASEFRLMAKVKIPGVTAAELKVQPWMLDNSRKRARGWNEEHLGKAIRIIADADAAVKGESRTPEAVIDLCIMEIARIR